MLRSSRIFARVFAPQTSIIYWAFTARPGTAFQIPQISSRGIGKALLMHDLNYFREHLAQFEQMAGGRGAAIDFAAFRTLDRERREVITAVERLKSERNRAGEEIARRKRAGENAEALLS